MTNMNSLITVHALLSLAALCCLIMRQYYITRMRELGRALGEADRKYQEDLLVRDDQIRKYERKTDILNNVIARYGSFMLKIPAIVQQIYTTADFGEVTATITQLVSDIVPTKRVDLYYLDTADNILKRVSSTANGDAGEQSYELGEGLIGRAARERMVWRREQLETIHPRKNNGRQPDDGLWMAVPICFRERVLGVIGIGPVDFSLGNESDSMRMPIDMAFLGLVNLRLDHVKAYHSASHYGPYRYMAKRWTTKWGKLPCRQISTDIIQQPMRERRQVSAFTANKDLRYLRATFKYGVRQGYIPNDPTDGLGFFPVEKKAKYVPAAADLDIVIACADPDTQDYLWVIRETMARVGEINQLTWDDVNLESGYVILYTRKKSGGHLTPRKVPMTRKLREVLSRRYQNRDASKPWVFWHRYLVQNASDLVDKDPQLRERQSFVRLEHPVIGECNHPAPPVKLSKSPAQVKTSPCLGEHNDYVYTQLLGIPDEEYVELLNAGIFE